MPTTFFWLLLAISITLHFNYPIAKVIYVPYSYLGWLFIAIGATLAIWPDFIFKKNKTTIKPHGIPTKLITSGPYRISRHPIYLGFTLILIGVTIIHGTIISFPFPLLFAIIIDRKFIRMEEKNMEKAFGKDYLEYKKKVRKWI